MTKKKLEIIIIVFATLIVLGCLSYYFLYTRMSAAVNDISDLYQQSVQNMQTQEAIKNSESSLAVLQPQIQQIDGYIIPPDGEVTFINEVEALAQAQKLHVEINSVVIENSSDLASAGLEYLDVKVTTTGSWAGTYAFLSRLLALPNKISVNQADLALVSDAATVAVPSWQSDFDITVLKKTSPNE